MRRDFVNERTRIARKFDPELKEDFIAIDEFNRMCGDENGHKKFNRICGQLNRMPDQELKEAFLTIRKKIEIRAKEAFLQLNKGEKDDLEIDRNSLVDNDLLNALDEQIKKEIINEKLVFNEEFAIQLNDTIDDLIRGQIIELIALIRVVLFRKIGIDLHDVQIIAGIKLYHGKILEMKTGEGKTFVIPIAATLHGVKGKLLNGLKVLDTSGVFKSYQTFQVKVVTANDYLARRDYSLLNPLYSFFDLPSYFIQEFGGKDKVRYYDFQILYCTCRHLCHLSLYDMMRSGDALPSLPTIDYVAILDEVDQILLDESLTPHIISESGDLATYDIDIIYQASHFSSMLGEGNSVFQEDDESAFTGPFKYYLYEVFRDFATAYNDLVTEKGLKELEKLFDEIKIGHFALSSDIYDRLLTSDVFGEFCELICGNFRILVNDYLPFLWKILSVRCESIIKDDLIYKFKSKVDFANYPITELPKFLWELCLEDDHLKEDNQLNNLEIIENFLCDPSSFLNIANRQKCFELIEMLKSSILGFLSKMEVLATDDTEDVERYNFKDYLVQFINKDLPSISGFFIKDHGTIVSNLYLNEKEVGRYLSNEGGKIKLNKKVEKILDEESLSEHFSIALKETTDLRILRSTYFQEMALNFISKFVSVPFYAYLEEQIDSFQIKYSDADELIAILERLQIEVVDGSLVNLVKNPPHKSFEAKLENAPHIAENKILQPEIKKLKNKLKNLIDDDKILKNFQGVMKRQEQFSSEISKLSGEDELIDANIRQFVTMITYLPKLFLEHTGGAKLLYFDILTASFLEMISLNLKSDLFEEYKSDGIDLTTDARIKRFYRSVVVEKLANPFHKGRTEISNHSNRQILNLAAIYNQVFTSDMARRENDLIEFMEQHNWLYKYPFYNLKKTDKEEQNTKLESCAQIASKCYLRHLRTFKIAKGISDKRFSYLVKQSFNVNKYYVKDENFIVTKIDLSVEKHKLKFDPYLKQHELNEVKIVNSVTGRVLQNNRWSNHIHSCVEAKENLLVKGTLNTIIQVTPQTYFGKYSHLSGLSGTTIIARNEFKEKFGLEIEYIPTNQRINRLELPEKVFIFEEGAIQEMAFDALELVFAYRAPVLLIMDSIANSDLAFDCLENLQTNLKSIKKKVENAAKAAGISNVQNISLKKFRALWNEIHDTDVSLPMFKGWSYWVSHEVDMDDLEKMKPLMTFENIPGIYKINIDRLAEQGVMDRVLQGIKRFDGMTFESRKKAERFLRRHLRSDSVTKEILKKLKVPFLGMYSKVDASFLNFCYKSLKWDLDKRLNLRMLNGRPEMDSKESEIVANAGKPDSILVATRVAGRGTDIKLEGQNNPGLHVLIFNHQESKRHDQQIYGRCGRQGDKGFFRFYSNFENGLLKGIARFDDFGEVAPLVFKAFSLFDTRHAPFIANIILKINNLRTNIKQEDFIRRTLKNGIDSNQSILEQNRNLQRVRQKKYGDIIHYREQTIASLDLNQRTIGQIMDKDEYDHESEKLMAGQVQEILDFFARMLLSGIKEQLVKEFFHDVLLLLIAEQAEDIKGLKPNIEEFFLEMTDAIEKIAFDRRREIELDINRSCFTNDFYNSFKLRFGLNSESGKSLQDIREKMSRHFEVKNSQINSVLTRMDDQHNHFLRKRSLKMYNEFFDIFQTNNISHILIRDDQSFKSFQLTSEYLVSNFIKYNSILRITLLKFIYQQLWDEFHAPFDESIRHYLIKKFSLDRRRIYEYEISRLIVSSFELPCESDYLRTLRGEEIESQIQNNI